MMKSESELSSLRGPDCLGQFKGQRVAISFTGGKDCHLAIQRSQEAGLEVVCLAIFHRPGGESNFKAHRVKWQETQAKAMGIPLVLCGLWELEKQANKKEELDFKSAYAAAIHQLQIDHNIKAIITGDIDYVFGGKTNFMQQVCSEHDCRGVLALLPLWKQPRKELMREMLLGHNLDIRMSCVKSPFFDESWIGRRLDWETVSFLESKDGLDLNGENGEYHTMVLNGPMYKTSLQFEDLQAEELVKQPGQKGDQRWWVISETAKLVPVT